MTRGLCVTGTDTGVGKTLVARLLTAALRRSGRPVSAFKPFASGPPTDGRLLLTAAGGGRLSAVTFLHCREPLAPAAVLGLGRRAASRVEIALRRSARAVARQRARGDAVVVEGLGGVLAPLARGLTVADLLVRLKLPVWIVARPGLGTLNHVLLSLESLRRRKVRVRRIVLSGYAGKSRVERTNRRLLRDWTGLPVTVVPWLASAEGERRVGMTLLKAFLNDGGDGDR